MQELRGGHALDHVPYILHSVWHRQHVLLRCVKRRVRDVRPWKLHKWFGVHEHGVHQMHGGVQLRRNEVQNTMRGGQVVIGGRQVLRVVRRRQQVFLRRFKQPVRHVCFWELHKYTQ